MYVRLSNPSQSIDAVITWVDGEDPAHKAKRLHYLLPNSMHLHENGINPHRWACGDELSFCLRGIENNAPWIGTIYIVTDAQSSDLSHLSKSLRAKIKIIDHREIFAGYHHVLPTFNSLAIESMLWRIEGLSERFIYFNDDVFLTAPLQEKDVFDGLKPVLRGKWIDFSQLGSQPEHLADPRLLHDFMQFNAAALLGFAPQHVFASAHVVHPMRVSVFADLFAQYEDAFLANIAHKFRAVSQFQPQSLHNGACLRSGQFSFADRGDSLHVRSGLIEDNAIAFIQDLFGKAISPDIKFLCINDLPQIEALIPDVRDWIEAAIRPIQLAA
jgi:Stealth protein CR2, conserved region 2/Stealth protein CR1, conserved region 1